MDPLSLLSAIPVIGQVVDHVSKVVDAISNTSGQLLDLFQTTAEKSGMPEDALQEAKDAYAAGMERAAGSNHNV